MKYQIPTIQNSITSEDDLKRANKYLDNISSFANDCKLPVDNFYFVYNREHILAYNIQQIEENLLLLKGLLKIKGNK